MAEHEEETSRFKRTKLPLRIVSILLIALAVISFLVYLLIGAAVVAIYLGGVEGEITVDYETNGSTFNTVISLIAFVGSLATSIIQFIAGRRGLKLARGIGKAETCQLLGITLLGLAVVSLLCSIAATGGTFLEFFDFLLSCLLPGAYYALARHEKRSSFWQGIKDEEEAEEEAEEAEQLLTDVEERYMLNDAGLLVPADPQDKAIVEFRSFDEAAPKLFGAIEGRASTPKAFTIRHCAANVFGSTISGTVRIPHQVLNVAELPFREDVAFAFRLDGESLTIISDELAAQQLFAYYTREQAIEKNSAAAVLFEVIAFAIAGNSAFLFDQQERLSHLENNMSEDVNEIPHDFDTYVSETRAELHIFAGFYRQLVDLTADIAESPSGILSQQAREYFHALSNQVERLNADAQALCDHALQIRDVYQSKIDVRQNKVMSLLTIVTSIFMPLTVITGWYGMNFKNMPEIYFKYGYLVVIAVAVIIVTVECIIFKRKKWF